MFHSASKSLSAYLSWLEVIQCPLVGELWHPLLWNLPITQSHTLFQPDKNNLLRFVNCWQGHCNSAWHQLLQARTNTSPNWDRPPHGWLHPLLFKNVPKNNYICAKVVRRGPKVYRPYLRRLESLTIPQLLKDCLPAFIQHLRYVNSLSTIQLLSLSWPWLLLTSNNSSFLKGLFVRVTAFLNSSVGRCLSAVLLLFESFISDPQWGWKHTDAVEGPDNESEPPPVNTEKF